MEGMGPKLIPVVVKHLVGYQGMYGPMDGTSWIYN